MFVQASQARLYQFSPETRQLLQKFPLQSSKVNGMQARVFSIDKKTFEISACDDGEPLSSLEELSDELPDHVPRFVLLSYPVTLKSGRKASPYVMVNYMPVTVGAELRMLYAGAKELMRNTAQVGKVIDVTDGDAILEIDDDLREG